MTLNTTEFAKGVTTVSQKNQTTTDSPDILDKIQVIKTTEVSHLNEYCIYFREERLFECQNWKISTTVSDFRRACYVSFKLPYTAKEALPDIDKTLRFRVA